MSGCDGCTVERLLELLEYDKATGLFRWRHPTSRQAQGWFKGNKSVRQYRRLYIDGKHYLAHVVAWALVTGEWPQHEIDHEDRDQGSNVWSNLRPATRSQQGMNRTVGSNSFTGVVGVTRYGNRFRANIRREGTFVSLGVYDTLQEAAEARSDAERRYYGEYAPE